MLYGEPIGCRLFGGVYYSIIVSFFFRLTIKHMKELQFVNLSHTTLLREIMLK
jgi:hypothetical protein